MKAAATARRAGSSSRRWHVASPPVRTRRDATAAVARLAALTAAAVPTGDALASCARGANPVLAGLHASVRRGVALSAAMAAPGMPFTEAEVAVVRAGERGGSTSRSLALLAARHEREATGRRRLASALAYPAVLVSGGLAALAFLSIVVLPSFTSMYDNASAELPWTTRALLAFGTALRAHGAAAMLGVVVAGALLSLARRRVRAFARALDRAAVDLPLLRALAAPRAASDLCSLVALLVGSGCEVDEALSLAARATPNRVVAARVADALRALRRGAALSRAWAAARLDRDGTATPLLEVAEATGGYADAFARLAALEDAAAEQALSRLCRLAEPAAVVVMAAAVGGGVLAVYQPMLGSASLLLGGNP